VQIDHEHVDPRHSFWQWTSAVAIDDEAQAVRHATDLTDYLGRGRPWPRVLGESDWTAFRSWCETHGLEPCCQLEPWWAKRSRSANKWRADDKPAALTRPLDEGHTRCRRVSTSNLV
jgi:hypothetical protein